MTSAGANNMTTEPVEVWLTAPMEKLCDGLLYAVEGAPLQLKLLPYGKDYTPGGLPTNRILLPPKEVPAGPLLTEWRQIEQSMARQRDEAHK